MHVAPRMYEIGEGAEPIRAAVVGCGGAGCNSLKYVPGHLGIEKFALNADVRKGQRKISGRSLVVPRHELLAASETDPRIPIVPLIDSARALAGAMDGLHAVFPVCGLGGGAGWRCAALAARSAREAGALAVCVAIMPFSAEAPSRRSDALVQAKELRKHCDGLIVLHNDNIVRMAPNLPFLRAMEIVSELALLVPGEIAASASASDVQAIRDTFSRSNYSAADVASIPASDGAYGLAKALLESEWMGVDPDDVRSALLLVGNTGDGTLAESVASELRDSVPNLEVLAFGSSRPSVRDMKTLRGCAVLGSSEPIR